MSRQDAKAMKKRERMSHVVLPWRSSDMQVGVRRATGRGARAFWPLRSSRLPFEVRLRIASGDHSRIATKGRHMLCI